LGYEGKGINAQYDRLFGLPSGAMYKKKMRRETIYIESFANREFSVKGDKPTRSN